MFEPDSTAGVHDDGGSVLVVFLQYHSGEEAPSKVFAGLGHSPHSVVNNGFDLGVAASIVEVMLPGLL